MSSTSQKETWQRRKHRNIKPNFGVRFIYNVVDWLGEYGDIVNATKRGTGNFIATSISTLITLSILIASTIHSIDLLERAGYHSGLQYLMLLPFEVLFLSSSSALSKSILKGKYYPFFPWAGFLISLVFIWRSNVTGLSNNIDGQVLAWSTPFLLLISKGLLAWYVKNGSKNAAQKTEEKPPIQMEEIIEKNEEENKVDLDPIATDDIQNSPPEIEHLESPKTIEENHDIATPETEEEIQKSTPEIAIEKRDESEDDIEQMEKNVTTDEPAENKNSSLPEEVVDEVAKKPSKTLTKKKATKKKKTTVKVDDLTIENIALDYQKEHGELPGRKLLAQVAKCTEYRARKALAKLEETPPKKEEEMEKPKLELVNKKAVV